MWGCHEHRVVLVEVVVVLVAVINNSNNNNNNTDVITHYISKDNQRKVSLEIAIVTMIHIMFTIRLLNIMDFML